MIVSSPISGSNYIRLANINAPEKRQKGYETAKAKLKSRIGGKRVWITPVGKSYGRVVARVRKVRKDKR
jgi:endonuclease YncB( thermonuclease family)